jgi:hypothetical protein
VRIAQPHEPFEPPTWTVLGTAQGRISDRSGTQARWLGQPDVALTVGTQLIDEDGNTWQVDEVLHPSMQVMRGVGLDHTVCRVSLLTAVP